MSFKPFKRIAAVAAVLLTIAGTAHAEAPAAAALSKVDVEKIVHDYIISHPMDILTAVQNYQETTARNHQMQTVKTNRESIYNDVMTPTAGNEDGDVTIVEFFDYNCGYCKKVAPLVIQLIQEDKNVRVLFKDFPILGPSSETASQWALAAYKQKKYFEFFKAMMNNHSPINDTMLEQIAKDIGMDVAKGKSDAKSTDVMMQIERNRSLAANMEIHGTPAFIIGDDLAPGAVGLEEMKSMVAKARAAAQDRKNGKNPG
jgi:protein-disulfide isomerase